MHKELGIETLVHGDDFVTTGQREKVRKFKTWLENRFEIMTKVIGSGRDEVRESRVLNKLIRRPDDGWECEPDQRHAEMIIGALGLEEAN